MPALVIETFVDGSFGENAYVVSTSDKGEHRVGWVIDPSFPPQVDELLAYVEGQQIALEKVILTHGHVDHVAGVDAVRAAHPQAALLLGAGDQAMLGDTNLNLSAPFGLPMTIKARADSDLLPGAELSLGSWRWKVLDTSGHSAGGRSLYCPAAGVVLVGDALFSGSIGRTDLPGSDHGQLIRNIREQLLTLPSQTVVYCGHGETTTVGKERKFNPFLSD